MSRKPPGRTPRVLLWVAVPGALLMAGCAARTAVAPEPAAGTAPCSMTAASPWIETWFAAWELTSRSILRLPDAPAPEIVFYDSSCVYTTSGVAALGAAPVDGPALLGAKLPWRAFAHGGSLTLPDASQSPVQLMSYTSAAPAAGPFFVMAAPSYWTQKGHGEGSGFTGVFLHEFAHTRQLRGLSDRLGPIDSTWAFPEELNDDAVQTHFGADQDYVAAYLAERDLLYRAAEAGPLEEARALAADALAMMRGRHARWFTGNNAVFADVDQIFLSLEGVGQWSAYAWLAHPDGGRLAHDAAIAKMLGRRRWWVQDEGLALLLVVDRLLPEWPALVFGVPSPGALDLLERAVGRADPR